MGAMPPQQMKTSRFRRSEMRPGHFRGCEDARDGITAVHEGFDAGQFLAKFASGVEVGEVFFFEAAFLG